MDLVSIVFLTAAVLGVLLVVLATIAVVVLLPPVRRRLSERANDAERATETSSDFADEER